MFKFHRPRFASAALSLALLVPAMAAHAAPVTGWVAIGGAAGFSGGSAATDSPVTTRADGDQIAANFDAVTLAVGQSITLTGSVTIDASFSTPQQFRWGLFDGDNPVTAADAEGYIGVWATVGGGDNNLARAHGPSPFGTSTASFIGSPVSGSGNLKANSPITFTLAIERINATEISISALATATNTNNAAVVFDWGSRTTQASPATFTYNSVAFLLGGAINGDQAIFSNIDVTFVPEPTSLALLGLGGLVMLTRR